MDVRRYQDADAPKLVELLERNSFGPFEFGGVMDADGVRRVFESRAVTDCLVGEKDGVLHGCIALSRNSGRRTLADDRRFAGLFMIDDAYRNSMLAGQLFKAIFTEAMNNSEIRSLHVEVNPANKRAMPLYLRVGFRALPNMPVDEDGYLEMVSHLPGISRDIIDRNLGAQSEAMKPALNWRMMRGGRNVDASENVEWRNGRWTISYPIDTGDLAFLAEADFCTGELCALTQTKGKPLTLPAADLPERTAETITEVAALAAHGLRCAVDSAGNIRVAAADGTELLHSFWPTGYGREPQSTRRQQTRHRIRLADASAADRVWLEDEHSDVRVWLRDTGEAIEFGARAADDCRVMLAPSVRLRPALHACGRPDDAGVTWQLAPLVRGVWPADWIDFEFAAPVTTAEEAWWGNGSVGMRMRWQGESRLEGASAPLLRSRAAGEPVTLQLTAAATLGSPAATPDGMHPVARPVRRRRATQPRQQDTTAAIAAEVALDAKLLRDDTTELTGGQHRIHLVRNLGVVGWDIGGETVCKGPFPATGTFGALANHRAAIWAGMIPDRDDLDLGTVWFDDAAALPIGYGEDAAQNTLRIVRATSDALDLEVCAHDDAELQPGVPARSTPAIALTPHAGAHPQIVVGVAGRLWRIGSGIWRTFADQAAITLKDGRALMIQPEQPPAATHARPQLLVRSVADGAHVTVTGGADAPLRVRLRVCPSRSVAEAEMFAWKPEIATRVPGASA